MVRREWENGSVHPDKQKQPRENNPVATAVGRLLNGACADLEQQAKMETESLLSEIAHLKYANWDRRQAQNVQFEIDEKNKIAEILMQKTIGDIRRIRTAKEGIKAALKNGSIPVRATVINLEEASVQAILRRLGVIGTDEKIEDVVGPPKPFIGDLTQEGRAALTRTIEGPLKIRDVVIEGVAIHAYDFTQRNAGVRGRQVAWDITITISKEGIQQGRELFRPRNPEPLLPSRQ